MIKLLAEALFANIIRQKLLKGSNLLTKFRMAKFDVGN